MTSASCVDQDGTFACSRCGPRQPDGEACRACGTDSMQDLRSRLVREMFADAEARFRRERNDRLTRYGAAIGVVVVVLVWLIPGYWDLFRRLRPRTLFMTQFGLQLRATGADKERLELRLVDLRAELLRLDEKERELGCGRASCSGASTPYGTCSSPSTARGS